MLLLMRFLVLFKSEKLDFYFWICIDKNISRFKIKRINILKDEDKIKYLNIIEVKFIYLKSIYWVLIIFFRVWDKRD